MGYIFPFQNRKRKREEKRVYVFQTSLKPSRASCLRF